MVRGKFFREVFSGLRRAVLHSNSLLAASWPGAACTRGRLPSPMMTKKTLDHHSAADQQATNDLPQCAARSRALHLRLSPRRDHLSQSHILHRLPSLAHWQLTTGLVPGLFVGAFCRDATLRAVNGAHAASKHLPRFKPLPAPCVHNNGTVNAVFEVRFNRQPHAYVAVRPTMAERLARRR